MIPNYGQGEVVAQDHQSMDPYGVPFQQGGYVDPHAEQNEMFQRNSELKVIQEYNREELVPVDVRRDYWGLLSKSVKLGFWNEADEANIFFHKNIIKMGQIMSLPKHKYTFEARQKMNMVDFLVFADFKRGVGMEKYRLNERTLQATSISQSIQGGVGNAKRGGFLAGIKNMFS